MIEKTQSLTVTPSVRLHVERLRTQRGEPLFLRVSVEGGGCAGFQYAFSFANAREPDDLLFGECVLTDPVSLEFLVGSEIDYVDELIGSEFRIRNPNAASGCGCGISFSTE